MKRKIFAFLLALSTLLSVTACSGGTSEDTGSADTTGAVQDTAVPETTTVDPNDRTQVKDSLPDGLKFDGDSLRIL